MLKNLSLKRNLRQKERPTLKKTRLMPKNLKPKKKNRTPKKPDAKKEKIEDKVDPDKKISSSLKRKFSERSGTREVEQAVAEQFKTGKIYARITSRPGQCGRADGYILEGEELAFYVKKMSAKKKK